jgi:hypothetical protein
MVYESSGMCYDLISRWTVSQWSHRQDVDDEPRYVMTQWRGFMKR